MLARSFITCAALSVSSLAFAVEEPEIYCSQNLPDHGLEVAFFGHPQTGRINRATLSEQSLIGPQLRANLRCRPVPRQPLPGADRYQLTYRCSGIGQNARYLVELYEGGISGRPMVRVYEQGRTRNLLGSMLCEHRS